ALREGRADRRGGGRRGDGGGAAPGPPRGAHLHHGLPRRGVTTDRHVEEPGRRYRGRASPIPVEPCVRTRWATVRIPDGLWAGRARGWGAAGPGRAGKPIRDRGGSHRDAWERCGKTRQGAVRAPEGGGAAARRPGEGAPRRWTRRGTGAARPENRWRAGWRAW